MAKIGILGGTFNPIHLGHIELAKQAYQELNLDVVWFMPSKNPPHKDNYQIISEKDRTAMVELAIADYKFFKTSDIELKREGITYTSYTLEYLHQNYSENEYYFIVGADSIFNIESWNRPKVLFKLATFVVACRDNVDYNELEKHCNYLQLKYNGQISIIHMDKVDISSSFIRDNIKHNTIFDFNKCLDKKVYDYIKVNKLYV
mgnify:CR=1 FL=1